MRRNGLEQLAPIAERDSDLFQIRVGQVREDFEINVVLTEDAGQCFETELLEPFFQI